ncbi:MAG: hypothetical protein JWP61_404 [Friedmanniella sp.]|nr:hypothetical protein [Friedmanniella sp.]
MTITPIDLPDRTPSPVYVGGMLVSGGSTLYVGGQNGTDADQVISTDLAEESRTAAENLLAVIEAAGGGITDLVQLTIVLVEGVDLRVAYAAAQPVFAGHRTAVTALVVRALGRPDAHIELAGVAVLA